VTAFIGMPMNAVYAAEGTFADRHALAQDLARAVMRWEQVPEIPLFSDNTAAFIHDLPADAIANAAGASDHVRVQVLNPVGVLDRAKQLGGWASPGTRIRTLTSQPRPEPRSARTDGAQLSRWC
jgi:hypothetical protein